VIDVHATTAGQAVASKEQRRLARELCDAEWWR